MQKYTIALSDFLTLMNKRMASRSTLFLVFKGTSLSLIGPWERPPFPSTGSDPRPPPNRADPLFAVWPPNGRGRGLQNSRIPFRYPRVDKPSGANFCLADDNKPTLVAMTPSG
jgi:hypothetical protein